MDSFVKKDIEKITYEVLKQSKSFDIFPTPVDSILNYTNFTIDNKINLLEIEPSFLEFLKDKTNKTKNILQSGLSKIKGIFYRDEKIIYIDPSLDKYLGKQNFVKLHEVGHGVLSWQNEIMLALDNDETLNE